MFSCGQPFLVAFLVAARPVPETRGLVAGPGPASDARKRHPARLLYTQARPMARLQTRSRQKVCASAGAPAGGASGGAETSESPTQRRGGKAQVYIARTPLVGLEAVADVIGTPS